jgi:hypothetical protein
MNVPRAAKPSTSRRKRLIVPRVLTRVLAWLLLAGLAIGIIVVLPALTRRGVSSNDNRGQPPYTPFAYRTQSPEPPTPTWAVGYFGGLDRENTFNPAYDTCWNGYLNGNLLELCAGHEQLGGDPHQGVILLRVFEQDQVTIVSDDVYETPNKVGAVHIVTANSNSVTVASEDGQTTFTFDIATRQWVLPLPTSSPSSSPLPTVTISP